MLNHIVVMGRLTRDPELRKTASDVSVTSFTVAVDRDFSQQDGQKETDFLDVVAWRSTAEFAAKYFAKGRMAVISGRLQIRNWEDKEGNKRRTAEILAENIYFGDSKKEDDGGSASAPRVSVRLHSQAALRPTLAAHSPAASCRTSAEAFKRIWGRISVHSGVPMTS